MACSVVARSRKGSGKSEVRLAVEVGGLASDTVVDPADRKSVV